MHLITWEDKIMYAQFIKDSYVYFVEESSSSLSDSNHRHLFDFLNYDLTPIKLYVDEFLTEQFDFSRMCLKDNRPPIMFNADYEKALQTNEIIDLTEYMIPNTYIQGIISTLANSHPFYTMGFNAEKEAESIVINGFNAKICASEYVMDKKEYDDIIEKLLTVPPFFPIGCRSTLLGDSRIQNEKYYKNYWEAYDAYSAVRRMKEKGINFSPPLFGIFETQRRLNNLLAELLDKNQTAGMRNKKTDSYKFLIDLTVLVIDSVIYEQYSIESLCQLLECEIYHMAINKIKIKKCKCCDAYFVSDDNRIQYCDRLIKGKKTCQKIGPNRTYWNQRKNDDKYKAYRKAFSKNSMRLSRGVITAEQFQYWREQAEIKRTLDSDDYFTWLDLTINEIRVAFQST